MEKKSKKSKPTPEKMIASTWHSRRIICNIMQLLSERNYKRQGQKAVARDEGIEFLGLLKQRMEDKLASFDYPSSHIESLNTQNSESVK